MKALLVQEIQVLTRAKKSSSGSKFITNNFLPRKHKASLLGCDFVRGEVVCGRMCCNEVVGVYTFLIGRVFITAPVMNLLLHDVKQFGRCILFR